MDEAQRLIGDLLSQPRFAHVVTFGSEMAMLARRDPSYRAILNQADLIVPDTIGVVYAARMLGCPVRERVPGVELVERLCNVCASHKIPVFLLGGQPAVAQLAGQALISRHAGLVIAGTQHGFFNESDDEQVAARIRASGAGLLLVALGFPKQERWIRAHANVLGNLVCMGVGGTFDILSGKLSRAPAGVRRLGLEWLYRLIREPRRLGRQLALPGFAFLVAAQRLREGKRDRGSTQDNNAGLSKRT
jgi:N-acetylglucosaminyldiphosphoundecaprenol N-acetyl-beta-D-mannosaminyltransferase